MPCETSFANIARQPWETPLATISSGEIVLQDEDEEAPAKGSHPVSKNSLKTHTHTMCIWLLKFDI